MITAALPLTAFIAGLAALSFVLEQRIPALSKVGASLLTLILGALVSNLGLVPAASPVYDTISGPVTMLAIAWLLLSVNLSDVKKVGSRMFVAFGLAVFGTALGALVGAAVFAPTLGASGWQLAGVFTGTYSGGSVNFVSVGRVVELPDALWAGATAADAMTTGIWMAATLLLPVWLARFYTPVPKALTELSEDQKNNGGQEHPFFARASLSALDLSVLVAAGLALLTAADLTARLIPQVHSVLWLTTYALILGQTRWFHHAEGALQLGTMVLLLFFVVIGIWSRVSEIAAVGFVFFFYTLVLVAVHGLVVYAGGYFLKLDLGTLSVASQASVGGPPSALAVAVAREWPGLVLPGIIMGLLGYAVGTYLGVGVANLVRGLAIGL
ncbi:MAG TPA: DUF819 family protein [Longimicrobiales bacterium]|nr:DUF819 family protein [Longimicrobiales bacterium]